MAYAVLDKKLLEFVPFKDAFVGKVTDVNDHMLRSMEKGNVLIPWKEWEQLRKGGDSYEC